VYALFLFFLEPGSILTRPVVLADRNLHTFCFLVLFLNWYFCVAVGCLSLSFFCCTLSLSLSLAVFAYAGAFNQDVSKWDTGAVTHMNGSKCTLSPLSLSVATPFPSLCFLNTTT
jgi:surface protein